MSIITPAASWITNLIQNITSSWKIYVNPEDTEETDTEETEYVTQVYSLGPLYPQKYILVEEIINDFTPAELNEGYHTYQEYAEANSRFGNIFKHQKFENADSVEKLHEYAVDWIKNNYHAGLTSFDISAIDMRLLNEDVDPYMVGDKIDVTYPDTLLHTEVTKTLTCISAEYDLYNPDKNKYKIGVPDAALNKAYGETTKQGGGGGGGTNTEDENDEEDASEQESTTDRLTQWIEWMQENGWALTQKKLSSDGDDSDFDTPHSRDPANAFLMNLMSDRLKTGEASIATLLSNHVKTPYLDVSGIINGEKVKMNIAELKELKFNEDDIAKIPITIDGHIYNLLGVDAGNNP